MNKKIKLSLLGTLIAGSALAVTLPIVSCSASADVALNPTLSTTAGATATAAFTAYVQAPANVKDQQELVTKGHIINTGTIFTDLLATITFVQKDDTAVTVLASDAIESFEVTTGVTVSAGVEIPAGVILTANLKSEYSTDAAITITLSTLGDGKAA